MKAKRGFQFTSWTLKFYFKTVTLSWEKNYFKHLCLFDEACRFNSKWKLDPLQNGTNNFEEFIKNVKKFFGLSEWLNKIWQLWRNTWKSCQSSGDSLLAKATFWIDWRSFQTKFNHKELNYMIVKLIIIYSSNQ
jgi:hypothetical protein